MAPIRSPYFCGATLSVAEPPTAQAAASSSPAWLAAPLNSGLHRKNMASASALPPEPPGPSPTSRARRESLPAFSGASYRELSSIWLPIKIFRGYIDFLDPVSSGRTPLAPRQQPRARSASISHLEKSMHFAPSGSTLLKILICAPSCSPCVCRTGRADVGPCPSHRGGSAGSTAVGGAARTAAYYGCEVANFAT